MRIDLNSSGPLLGPNNVIQVASRIHTPNLHCILTRSSWNKNTLQQIQFRTKKDEILLLCYFFFFFVQRSTYHEAAAANRFFSKSRNSWWCLLSPHVYVRTTKYKNKTTILLFLIPFVLRYKMKIRKKYWTVKCVNMVAPFCGSVEY